MREVRFYYEYEEYGFLSNFFLAPMLLEGKEWPSVEHYYQAAKTLDPVFREVIRKAPSADAAKKLGRDPACVLREDWDEVKADVMRRAIAVKFAQHPDLRSMLLETGDAVLVENSKKDYYWGCGADGSGKSMLGALLMELRESLAGDGS
jgi:N-glycosidase YbiA